MRPLALLFFLFVLVHAIQAQENTRMELRHIRLEEAMSQHDFAMTYNICWEQVHHHLYHREVFTIPADTDLYFPPDLLPCYNEAGQRLIFFENGAPVYQPYYSDLAVYTTHSGETYESLSRSVNVCIEDISWHNEHFYPSNTYPVASYNNQTFFTGQELFIPNTPPCYDEQGRKLAYTDEGLIPLEGELYIDLDYSFQRLSYLRNICPETILAANYLSAWPSRSSASINSRFASIIIPINTQPCYRIYLESDETSAEIRDLQLLCREDLERYNSYNPRTNSYDNRYYLRTDAPCFDSEDVPEGEQADLYQQNLAYLVRQYNVCASDLLAQPRFLNTSSNLNTMILIPDTPPCYDENGYKLNYPQDGSAPYAVPYPSILVTENTERLLPVLWEAQICLSDFFIANPHLEYGENVHWQNYDYLYNPPSASIGEFAVEYGTELFLPESSEDCYKEVSIPNEGALYDLAIEENVCIERLQSWRLENSNPPTYMIPRNHEACYDANGHRLSYIEAAGEAFPTPVRLENEIYVVPYAMSTYELSRRLNVCIEDLLALNPGLSRKVPHPRLEIFVPDTLPCYDEITGQQLIFTDENGEALAEARLSEYPLYTVVLGDSWGTISRIYNVCENRLIDFNEGFLPNVWEVERYGALDYYARAEGIFEPGVIVRIPTDRPPCYDLTGEQPRLLRYVCYDNPIDMSIENPDAVINPDGTHCYNVEDPATVIWDNGNHYLYQKREGSLYSNDFMAWCFGVSSWDILGENSLVYIWFEQEVLVKNPTRSCYAHTPDGLENIHWVTRGETLRDIAWQYGKLPQWIAEANGLTNPDIIWEYQRLVIPEGINLWDVSRYLSGFFSFIAFAFALRFALKRRALASMKKKNKSKV